MGGMASFLLDPLNITGIQDGPRKRPQAPTYAPPAQGGFMESMGGWKGDGKQVMHPEASFDFQMKPPPAPPPPPSWNYVPGKGPQFQQQGSSGSWTSAPSKGNRV